MKLSRRYKYASYPIGADDQLVSMSIYAIKIRNSLPVMAYLLPVCIVWVVLVICLLLLEPIKKNLRTF